MLKKPSCSKHGWHESIKFISSNMSHQIALRFFQLGLQSLVSVLLDICTENYNNLLRIIALMA